MFGLSESGFKAKRLEDIQKETRQSWLDRFGGNFDLDFRTPPGQIKEILDERIVLIWEALEALYQSQYPRSASGAYLDDAVTLTGISRKAATFSSISTGRAFGTLGTSIPAGTIFSVNGNEASKFQTDSESTIDQVAVNEVQKIDFNETADSGTYKITFEQGSTVDIAYDATLVDIQAAVDTVLGSGACVVSGDITSANGLTFSYAGPLAGLDIEQVTITDNLLEESAEQVITTNSTIQEGSPVRSGLISLTALSSGPTIANAGSLTVIDSPVVGLDSFTNEEDATIGRARETDAELKVRQIKEVQIAGSATLEAIRADVNAVEGVTGVNVFENNTAIEDADGRPPRTVDVVVQGGEEAEIASALFNTVAGGVGYFGDITEAVIDSDGFSHDIKFSRPTEVDIYIEIDLNTDPSRFPAGGLTAVRDAILAYGEALEVGDDVIVYGSNPSLGCAFLDVTGITDFSIRVGKTVSPTLDDNVAIGPREISAFDSSRIVVNQI